MSTLCFRGLALGFFFVALLGLTFAATSARAADDKKAPGKAEEHAPAEDASHKKNEGHDDADHEEGGGHGLENPHDLSHSNGSSQLEKVEEYKYDLSIYTLIVFLLLLAILWKFAWGPICEGLDKREKSIADQIEEARLGAEKATETLRRYQAKLDASADEVREAMAEARRAAETAKEQILAEAKEAASRERDRAVADIEAAKNAALQAMAQKSVDSAVSLASKIVRRQVSSEDHADLIRESLDQFSSQN